jgi:predicted metal-dependent hydrolase
MLLPRYTHIVNPRLKYTYIGFDEEGELVIRSPKASQHYIETLLIQRSAWIKRAKEKIRSRKGRIRLDPEGGEISFLGRVYPLQFKAEEKDRDTLYLSEEDVFIFVGRSFDHGRCSKALDAFYRKEVERIVTPLLRKWSDAMALFPAKVRYQKTRRQWGSCSSRNTLSFNTMLAKVPVEAIEYVVVHELVHIRHKHHQRAFWKLVEDMIPDYRERQAILRQYTPQ